jgi:signal peptidase I
MYRFGVNLWRKEPFRWFLTILVAAFVGIAAGHTVLSSFGSVSVVDGESMSPTYSPGARVYTTPISTALNRGDIVLLDDGGTDFALKRVIGLPGETVRLMRGYVFINCRMLQEPYLPKHTFTFPDERNDNTVFHLDTDEYFVMGDNRSSSSDSRFYGPINYKRIKSRVPLPTSFLRPRFVPYTLPAEGKRTIRSLADPVLSPPVSF